VIGALFGAGFFTSSLILGLVIKYCKNIKLIPKETGRDIIFYIVGVIYIFAVAIYGEINMTLAIGFFVIYGSFILFVICVEHRRKKGDGEKTVIISKEEEINEMHVELEELEPPEINENF